jgi:hypothetical protein
MAMTGDTRYDLDVAQDAADDFRDIKPIMAA